MLFFAYFVSPIKGLLMQSLSNLTDVGQVVNQDRRSDHITRHIRCDPRAVSYMNQSHTCSPRENWVLTIQHMRTLISRLSLYKCSIFIRSQCYCPYVGRFTEARAQVKPRAEFRRRPITERVRIVVCFRCATPTLRKDSFL